MRDGERGRRRKKKKRRGRRKRKNFRFLISGGACVVFDEGGKPEREESAWVSRPLPRTSIAKVPLQVILVAAAGESLG